MRILITILLFTFSVFQGASQSFTLNNNLEIMVKLDGEQCLVHTVEPKQTLYSIAKLYNIPVKEIMAYNKFTEDDVIYQGNMIYIPLNHNIYSKNITPANPEYVLKPVVYTVRPKDSFYGITHRYFHIDPEVLLKNNQLKTKDLTIGQGLIIGWIALKKNYSEWAENHKSKSPSVNTTSKKKEIIKNEENRNDVYRDLPEVKTVNTLPIDKTDEIITNHDEIVIDKKIKISESDNEDKKSGSDIIEDDNENQDESYTVEPIKKSINETGIAMWNKMGTDKKNSFVLHPTAKINSVIELHNPLTNRTAYAKVIAHIPDNTYESDISIILSPKVAERLGALDDRFQIHMTYYE